MLMENIEKFLALLGAFFSKW